MWFLKKICFNSFIASKVYYFGVGGGITDFVKLVEKDETLMATVIKSYDDGKSNVRQMIKINKK